MAVALLEINRSLEITSNLSFNFLTYFNYTLTQQKLNFALSFKTK